MNKQPKVVKIKDCADKKLYSLPDSPIQCVIQEREDGDNSKVVYIHNPKYVKGSKAEAPYISFTSYEYEVVEWTSESDTKSWPVQ
jgi:hypothetical protein